MNANTISQLGLVATVIGAMPFPEIIGKLTGQV